MRRHHIVALGLVLLGCPALAQAPAATAFKIVNLDSNQSGQAQAVGEPGHRPGARNGELGSNGREIQRRAQDIRGQLADRQPVRGPEPPDWMTRGIEPPEQRDRVVVVVPVAAP